MADHDARIRLKLGHIEIEYEGNASFLRDGLLATVKELLELQKKNPSIAAPASAAPAPPAPPAAGGVGQFDHSTDTIATLLKADSGPDLVMAAAAHLHFVKGQPKFTRKQIVAEMKSSTSHYKKSYFGNLSTALTALTSKDRLRLLSKDTYAVSNTERTALEAKLANA
jgi:hypothetical protein